MRTFFLLVAAVLGAIGGALGILAGVGDTNSVGYGDISAMFSGVTQYPDMQVAFGLFSPGDPVADFSEVLDLSAGQKGTTLAQHEGTANVELFFFLEKQPLVELISSGQHLYAHVNFSLLRPTLPTASEQAQLGRLQSEIGNRWIKVPLGRLTGLLQRFVPNSSLGALGSGISPATGNRIVASVEQAIREHAQLSVGTGPNGDNGVVLSGSVASLFDPIFGALGQIGAVLGQRFTLPPSFPSTVPGNYRVGFFADQTGTLRQIDVGLHIASSSTGFGIVINHAHITIAPPQSVQPISASAIADLVGLAKHLLPSSLLPSGLLAGSLS